MEEQNKEHLLRAISEFSNVEAPDVWSNIESQLSKTEDNKNSLEKAVGQLPQKQAPDIWFPIEVSLPKKQSFHSKWMVAASIVLFLCSVFLFVSSYENSEESELVHSTEILENFNVALEIESLDTGEDAILNYIRTNCRRLALTCNDPEFKGLLETYIELNEAKEELVQELEKKNQPQLMKYLIRVEKNQTKVGKNMLKKLRNS
ncbi:hypothetical protein [Ekhidna sp.]